MLRNLEFQSERNERLRSTDLRISARLDWPEVWGRNSLLISGRRSISDTLSNSASHPEHLLSVAGRRLEIDLREVVADLQAWEMDQRGAD